MLTTACERCDASGEITETRPLRLDELSSTQFSFLFEADLYREHGDRDEEDIPSQAGGPGPHSTPNAPSSSPGANIPSGGSYRKP